MENQDIDIKNLEFTSEDTGYFLTKTYSEYKWKFILDGINREISLYHSKILGRRTIYLGNREICRYQRYTYNFKYSFPIDVHTISISQSEDTYILKIDGIPFNKLLNEQKLRRFNIIREIFADKNDKNKKLKIKPLMTYKGGRGNIKISNRTDSKRDIYKTNIYSANRENDIENDKNIINTSTKRTNNTIDTNINTNINSDYYNSNYNNYDEESSENLSNKAIDGGDSQRDEEEEEQDDINNNNSKENNLDDELFKTQQDNIFENGNNEEDFDEEIKEEKLDEDDNEDKNNENININNINNIENKEDKDDSSDEEEEKEEKNKINEFNDITNELMPIKSDKKNKEKNKKIPKIKIEKKEKKIKKKNKNYNYDEDDIYNINNENNVDNDNINNINNENHIDLLGEEIYNSSRDKNNINNIDNIDNNFNINYYISQQNI